MSCIHNILSTCQLCYVSMEFYQPFHSCKRNFWRLWCQRLIKEEGQTPPPPPQTPCPGSKPSPPPVLRSNASLVRGSALKCSAVVVWSGVVTVPWVWGQSIGRLSVVVRGCAAELPGTRGSPTTRGFVSKGGVSVVCFQGRVTVSEGLLAMQVLDGLLRWGRAAGDGCVEVHRQWAVAGNVRLLLWCRCWYRGTHVGAVVVLCIQSEEAVARCDLAVCVLLHVWSAGSFRYYGCASVCTALEQNKTLTSFTLNGMLCSGVCSVQVIGVLWCKCSGAVITGHSFSRLPFGSGHCGLHHAI